MPRLPRSTLSQPGLRERLAIEPSDVGFAVVHGVGVFIFALAFAKDPEWAGRFSYAATIVGPVGVMFASLWLSKAVPFFYRHAPARWVVGGIAFLTVGLVVWSASPPL